MIPSCGPLPDYMETKFRELVPNNESNASPISLVLILAHPEPYMTSLQYLLYLGIETISATEIRVVTDFLSSMLQMDPKDQLTPSELMQHRWLSDCTNISLNNPCICGSAKYGR